MGQYYKGAVLKKDFLLNTENCVLASVSPYDYDNGAKLMEHSWIGNGYVNAVSQLIGDEREENYFGYPFVWVGDYADDVNGVDIYGIAHEAVKKYKDANLLENEVTYKYILNLDKKQYVEIPGYNNDWQIHPLPLLTASGNGRGGGDYHGDNEDMVGIWAYDCIGLSNQIPEGFEKLKVEFKEDR